jgi:hypothetical protein
MVILKNSRTRVKIYGRYGNLAPWIRGVAFARLVTVGCMCGVVLANRGANVIAVTVQGDKALLAVFVSLPYVKGVNMLSVLLTRACCT